MMVNYVLETSLQKRIATYLLTYSISPANDINTKVFRYHYEKRGV